MGKASTIRTFAVCWVLCLTGTAFAKSSNLCSDALLRAIPARSPSALSGSEFAQHVEPMSEHDREAAIQVEVLAGNIPAFLRRLVPVKT